MKGGVPFKRQQFLIYLFIRIIGKRNLTIERSQISNDHLFSSKTY
jgi:hypothetical protein